MLHLGSVKPESIASLAIKIQIVDTLKSLETRVIAGFPVGRIQINRTAVIAAIQAVAERGAMDPSLNRTSW
jgi:hypothetical protein